MATVTKSLKECDVRGCTEQGESVQGFVLIFPGERIEADLCYKHVRPLVNLRKSIERPRPRQRGINPIPREDIPRKEP